MIDLSFNTDVGLFFPRPIFQLSVNNFKLRCLVDTGADVPVFCSGQNIFELCFRDSVYFKDVSISGFGKQPESTPMYTIPIFELRDTSNNSISYDDLKINVINKPNMPFDLILSASMFTKMKLTFDNLGSHHTLSIQAEKQHYGVGYLQNSDKIYIFSADEADTSGCDIFA